MWILRVYFLKCKFLNYSGGRGGSVFGGTLLPAEVVEEAASAGSKRSLGPDAPKTC